MGVHLCLIESVCRVNDQCRRFFIIYFFTSYRIMVYENRGFEDDECVSTTKTTNYSKPISTFVPSNKNQVRE